MLPNNFDFTQMPKGEGPFTLKEIGMLASRLEDIDIAITEWVKNDLRIATLSNEGEISVPVLWQAPERAYQIKHKKELRDDAGALKLPLISVERTAITKDPARKGSFQANLYSANRNGRAGRFVIAKRIVPDKTRNFAVAAGTRTSGIGVAQKHFPRVNKKVVIQTVSIPIPVYVSVDYKITLKSEYQQQMNDMVAPFIGRTGQINAFVMRRNGHLYEAFIQQAFAHNNTVSNLGEEMRMFGTDITINVLGYLIGEGESDNRPIVRIDENTVEYQFPSESEVPPGAGSWFNKS
tara:strand:- start:403 stop:1281 length:879 start_codon:yes stop_codon:yes gene_type:complete